MTIHVGCSMGLAGCKIEDDIEVDDAASPEDIDQATREWAFQHFEYWVESRDGLEENKS